MISEEKLIEECTCLDSQDFCQGCKNSLWNQAYQAGKLVGIREGQLMVFKAVQITCSDLLKSGLGSIDIKKLNINLEEEKKL
jgi:hypothetical protein